MENPKTLYLSLSNPTLRAQDPNLKHPRDLCETLFHQLHTTFKTLFSSLPLFDGDHEAGIGSDTGPNPRLWPLVEDAAIVLRCCMVSLTLAHSDQKFLRDKTRFVLRALKAFVSVDVGEHRGRTVLRLRNFVSGADVELSGSCRPFLCAVLEVLLLLLLLSSSFFF